MHHVPRSRGEVFAVPELTEQQISFVRHFVSGNGNATEAARAAGYSAHTADTQAWQLLRKPHISEAIHREQRRAFVELAGIAIGQTRRLLEDTRTPPGARVELIKDVLNRAGLLAPKTAPEEMDEWSLRDIPLAELLKLKESHESRRAAANDAQSGVDRAA